MEVSLDLNVRAFRTVQAALAEPVSVDKRSAAARKGGLKGGAARSIVLTKERRREIAIKANKARWKNRATS